MYEMKKNAKNYSYVEEETTNQTKRQQQQKKLGKICEFEI
jgi:hypothetical protein